MPILACATVVIIEVDMLGMPRLLTAFLLALLASTGLALAQTPCAATNALGGLNCISGVNGSPYRPVANPAFATAELAELIGLLVSTLLTFLGVIFMLLIIYAGFVWMTARGNETAVENAKHTLTSASIGLGVILGAYALVQLIEYFINQSTVFQ